MESIAVGEVFPQKDFPIGQDAVILSHDHSGFYLITSMRHLSTKEKRNFTNGDIHISIGREFDLTLFTFKFGENERMDASFCMSMYSDAAERVQNLKELLVESTDTQGFDFTCILVDSSKMEVVSLKLIGLSNEISKCLLHYCEKDLELRTTQTQLQQNISMSYKNYTTEQLYRRAEATQFIVN